MTRGHPAVWVLTASEKFSLAAGCGGAVDHYPGIAHHGVGGHY